MRLSSSWVFAAAAASTSTITLPTTSGFQQQQRQRQQRQRAPPPSSSSSSSMRVSATMNEAATSTTSDEASTTTTAMTYADVNSLAFRALQRECKSLGLSAVGTTAALRGRLLGHHGLERVAGAVDVATLAATAAEIEVSLRFFR